MLQQRAIVTMEEDTVTKPSNGTSFNDLEWPVTPDYKVKVTALFNAEYLRKGIEILIGIYAFLKNVISNDLEWLSEIFNDTKHRAVSLRQLSFLFIFTTTNTLFLDSPRSFWSIAFPVVICTSWHNEYISWYTAKRLAVRLAVVARCPTIKVYYIVRYSDLLVENREMRQQQRVHRCCPFICLSAAKMQTRT